MKTTSIYYSLITGASAGIGRAMAEACARRNMNLILVALPGKELNETADYLRCEYGVRVEVFACDLTQQDACRQLVRQINEKNLCINMLINNAGVGCSGAFDHYPASFYEHQILLNVMSLTILTRLLIENMKKLEEAYIMNVASMFGFFYPPFKDVYAATKSFVITFSRSLRQELKHSPIHVSVLCPGAVRTNKETCQRLDRHGWWAKKSAMMPGEVAEAAIKRMLRNKAIIIPGLINRIFLMLDRLLPSIIKEKVLDSELRTFATMAA
jgi:hypothetical protein